MYYIYGISGPSLLIESTDYDIIVLLSHPEEHTYFRPLEVVLLLGSSNEGPLLKLIFVHHFMHVVYKY